MKKSLVVLVADGNMYATLKGLFQQPAALGIRISPSDVDIFIHPRRDPGVYRGAPDFLRPYIQDYDYALVMFDRVGCGIEEAGKRRKTKPVAELQEEVRKRLERNGWKGRCQVIIIDPELEIWLWISSPSVAWLFQIDFKEWLALIGSSKPNSPKESLEKLLEKQRIPRSSSLYEDLAKTIAEGEAWRLQKCNDPAFQCLQNTLQQWFGAKAEPNGRT